jgi:hypothetical protein
VFFKQLKQHQKIKTFIETTPQCGLDSSLDSNDYHAPFEIPKSKSQVCLALIQSHHIYQDEFPG